MADHHPDFLGETVRRISLQAYPDTRQFVVQHLYPDTLRLLLLLHEYVPILCVIGIGYSGSKDVVKSLNKAGISVITPGYDALELTISQELKQCLDYCAVNHKRLIIHEVGGYAIDCLHRSYRDRVSLVVGAIEVTKQGVWTAEQIPDLLIPQVNCAQTRLKHIEGKMVGESVVTALDVILRELGYSVVGRHALVLGYGWVGKGTAIGLKHRGVSVSVYDTDIIQNVEATVDGFLVPRSLQNIQSPHIVLGATGRTSITKTLIDQLPDKCFIASGASKNHEIDLNYVKSIATTVTEIHPYVECFEATDGRRLFIVNSGFPVNFTGPSVPDEIVEFLFSELIMLIPMLLQQQLVPGIYPLPAEQEKLAAQIWLDLR